MFALLLSAIVGLGGALLFLLLNGSSFEDMQGPPTAIAVIGALIVVYLLSHHSAEQRFGRISALIALGFVVVAGVVATRFDTLPIVKDLFTTTQVASDIDALPGAAPASVRIRRVEEGFVANVVVNGQSFEMLVDSGAATVVLRQSDAEQAGIDVRHLTFDTPLKTANGTSYLAPIRLKSIRVGQLAVDDVEALVAKPGTLNENLLGMSFLRRLTSYQVAGDFVTLRQ